MINVQTNFQSFGDPGTSLKDITIHVNECGRLFDELKNDQTFNLECFRVNGYCKMGNVGRYFSKNFRDFIFNGDVDPRHEGLVLTMYYTDPNAPDAVVVNGRTQNAGVLDNSDILEEAPITDQPSLFLRKGEDDYQSGYWDGYD